MSNRSINHFTVPLSYDVGTALWVKLPYTVGKTTSSL